uniref:Transthyretin-like family-containing protein n=1 Tax=Strongyloides papillosus TaxID=174720 RepID=A0A0N5CIR9_STREA
MIFKNIIVLLFIITLSVINAWRQNKRKTFQIVGRLACHNRHPNKIYVGIYQRNVFGNYHLLKGALRHCNDYFNVKARESRISERDQYFTRRFNRPMPVVCLTYLYTRGNLICRIKGIFTLPTTMSKDANGFSNLYNFGVLNISNSTFEDSKCEHISLDRFIGFPLAQIDVVEELIPRTVF